MHILCRLSLIHKSCFISLPKITQVKILSIDGMYTLTGIVTKKSYPLKRYCQGDLNTRIFDAQNAYFELLFREQGNNFY